MPVHGIDHLELFVGNAAQAAYYYTREAPAHWTGQAHSTIFKARPDEVLKGNVMMPLEKAKRRLGDALTGLKKKIKS